MAHDVIDDVRSATALRLRLPPPGDFPLLDFSNGFVFVLFRCSQASMLRLIGYSRHYVLDLLFVTFASKEAAFRFNWTDRLRWLT